MNEFNTKLIEVIRKLYIYAITPLGHSDRDILNREIALLIADLIQMNAQEIEQVNSTPIYELDLTVRSANLLDKGGIKTIGDLENASFDYISHLRNMGHLSLREIYTKLIEWKEENKRERIRSERNKSVCR